jgi:ribosomal protein S18 acetylase RimI-like enzyme
VFVAPPADPDSAGWVRNWTIGAGAYSLEPVTRAVARSIIEGGPGAPDFAPGALHDRVPQAVSFAIRDIASGAAAVLPTVWLAVRQADGLVVGDLGTHGPPDDEGQVEIGYSFAPSARGQGTGTAAVGALVRRLSLAPEVHRITAVTGVDNVASRRLLERLGFVVTDQLLASAEVRYELTVG